MRIASAVHVDGQAAVMPHDPVSRHAELRWGATSGLTGRGPAPAGWSACRPGTLAFQTVGAQLVPLDPPRPLLVVILGWPVVTGCREAVALIRCRAHGRRWSRDVGTKVSFFFFAVRRRR